MLYYLLIKDALTSSKALFKNKKQNINWPHFFVPGWDWLCSKTALKERRLCCGFKRNVSPKTPPRLCSTHPTCWKGESSDMLRTDIIFRIQTSFIPSNSIFFYFVNSAGPLLFIYFKNAHDSDHFGCFKTKKSIF